MTQEDYVKATDGFLSQVPLDLHFGLGGASVVDALEVRWPSGKVESWKSLPADRLLGLVEGRAEAAVEALPAWPVGTAPAARLLAAPDVELPLLAGGRARPRAEGRPLVLNFWAPDCAPCLEELPRLRDAASKYGDTVSFATVCVDLSGEAAARDLLSRVASPGRAFVATPDLLRGYFGEEQGIPVPSTWVFDGKGSLTRIFRRAVDAGDLAGPLEAALSRPEFPADYDLLAQDALSRRDYEAAASLERKALALRPEQASYWRRLGTALVGLKNEKEARSALENAVRLDADDFAARLDLGTLLFQGGNARDAIAQFQSALRLQPSSDEALMNLANAAAMAGQYPLALGAFDQAEKAGASPSAARLGRGKVYILMNNAGEARRELAAALEADPSLVEAKKLLDQLPR